MPSLREARRCLRRLVPGARISCTCVAQRATLDGVAQEITQRELRNGSGEIMRRLDEGESFVVTRNGVPVGELSPLRRHRFVTSDSAVAIFRHAPEVDLARMRADLDRVASQDLTPRG